MSVRQQTAAIAAPILALAGSALVILGFFLPWLAGTAEFAARDFSGFDLARLVRNFEIVASSSTEAGRDRLTALALYAMPALAVNGAVLTLLPLVRREAKAVALAVAATYAVAVLTGLGALSVASWTDLDRVLGAPMGGFFLSFAGAGALAISAAVTFAQARSVSAGGDGAAPLR